MLKGSDEWVDRKDYADTFFKRAKGDLPEMESSKAAANLLADVLQEGDKLLDVGCGAGHYLKSILNRIETPFDYTGIDATPAFVAKAKEAWKDQPNTRFQEGNIYELPFEDGTFDVVMCNNVLLHLPSLVKPLHELLRVAKRFVMVRTLIGDRSFKVQEVYSDATWPFSDVPVAQEFDDDGEPTSFGYENIYSEPYFRSVISRVKPNAEVKIFLDTNFDAEAINRSADTEGLPNATRVINGMQTLGYVITPWSFAQIQL